MSPQEVLEELTVNHNPAQGLRDNHAVDTRGTAKQQSKLRVYLPDRGNWRLHRGWQLDRGRGQLLGRGWGWNRQLLLTTLLGNWHRHWGPTSKTQKKFCVGTLRN